MTACIHCDEDIARAIFSDHDAEKSKPFCCYGCLTVYNILHEKGLAEYYNIKEHSGIFKKRAPVDIKTTQFTYLDDPQFLQDFTQLDADSCNTMEFYLEGIHCVACLWLIEKLPEYVPDVKNAQLNLDKSVVTISLHSGGKFSSVARELNNLGYPPHPLKKNQDATQFKKKSERAMLLKIGLAGAASGNIMIYAVSLYGGAAGELAHFFNALTVFFAIPVLTYCAYPFYKSAWFALKNHQLSIDVPISMALILGGIMGIFNLVAGIPENYFDSLTALVFLLLLSRYFLQKIQEKGLSIQDLHFFYHNESVLVAQKSNPQIFQEMHVKYLTPQDIIKIRPDEFIPADGEVLSGTSHLNNSLLTGESFPQKINPGDQIFAGGQNLDSELIIKIDQTPENSRFGKLLKNMEPGRISKSQIVRLSNTIAQYFITVVMLLSATILILKTPTMGFKHALEQALTLLIVTCPCALALATPLTFMRTLSKAAQMGIIIKNDEVIERLSSIKNIFLDKTGTITYGKLQVESFFPLRSSQIPVADIIYNLEINSKHPVALALLDFIKHQSPLEQTVVHRQEILGSGVSGYINDQFYEIKKNAIYENGVLIANFTLSDLLRPDSKQLIADLNHKNFHVTLLSGDRREYVEHVAQQIGLPSSQALGEMSPEEKLQKIKDAKFCMMVGDGANDAMSLKQATVGVAVLGAMDISLKAADVYLTISGLAPVKQLLAMSQETMKVIKRNLAISLIYNCISVIAVFCNIIGPLFAAILMPLSSLTVLIISLLGTKKLRALWKS